MSKTEKYERVDYITIRPFAEELQRLISAPPLGSIPMEITPAKATEMLKRNNRNRVYRPNYAIWLGKMMAADKWQYTGAPIIFSKSGVLNDGQHRLGGVEESGKTIKFQVVFGSPDEAFAFIDVGKKRTASDIFGINGVENSALMAATLSKIILIQRVWPTGVSNSALITGSELYKEYLSHPGLQDSIHFGRPFGKNKLLESSLATALHYIFAQKCRRDADIFHTMVGDGLGFKKKNDPAKRIRDRLDVNARTESKLSPRYKAALMIKAWNAFRANVGVGSLKLSDGEAFPRAR